MEVVLAADNTFGMPLAVTAKSILETLKSDESIRFHILDGGMHPRTKKRVKISLSSDNCSINWVNIEGIREKMESLNLPIREPYSIVTYFRFMIADILPSTIPKAIYLDSDTIVLRSLKPLWEIDVSKHIVAAVTAATIPTLGAAKHLERAVELTQIQNQPYFNAGVLVVNLQKWREKRLTETLFKTATEWSDTLLFQDQDVLNLATSGHLKTLHPQWNQTPYLLKIDTKELPFLENETEVARNSPAIVHFAANPKPWAKECLHPFRPQFFDVLDKTLWKGWRPTLIGRLRRRITLNLFDAYF